MATMIPALRYRDAPAAIDWLCRAFGFERHLVVPGDGDTIAHAQLVLGKGMIMLGSAREDAYDQLIRHPADAGGVTQAPYVVIADADTHCTQAKAAGAEILYDIEDQPHGGRTYTCRDSEGHIWNFGIYDPWRD